MWPRSGCHFNYSPNFHGVDSAKNTKNGPTKWKFWCFRVKQNLPGCDTHKRNGFPATDRGGESWRQHALVFVFAAKVGRQLSKTVNVQVLGTTAVEFPLRCICTKFFETEREICNLSLDIIAWKYCAEYPNSEWIKRRYTRCFDQLTLSLRFLNKSLSLSTTIVPASFRCPFATITRKPACQKFEFLYGHSTRLPRIENSLDLSVW